MTQVATVIREIPKGRKGASVMQNGLTELQAAFVREYATSAPRPLRFVLDIQSHPHARLGTCSCGTQWCVSSS